MVLMTYSMRGIGTEIVNLFCLDYKKAPYLTTTSSQVVDLVSRSGHECEDWSSVVREEKLDRTLSD